MGLLDDLMKGSETSFIDELLSEDNSFVKKVDVNSILKEYFTSSENTERDLVKSFHPSELSTRSCDMYNILSHDKPGKNGTFSARQYLIFDNGHSMHSRWQKSLSRYLLGTWKCDSCGYIINENSNYIEFLDNQGLDYTTLTGNFCSSASDIPIKKPSKCANCSSSDGFEYREWRVVSLDMNIAGRTDGILEVDGHRYVLELKSANSNSYETLSSSNLLLKFIKQVGLYMYVTGEENSMVIVENKNTQEYKVFYYKLSDLMKQDYFVSYIESVKELKSKLVDFRKGMIVAPKLHAECASCKYKGGLCKPN